MSADVLLTLNAGSSTVKTGLFVGICVLISSKPMPDRLKQIGR